DLDNPDKWDFPQGVLIPPGGFILVWADGRDSVMTGFHASFKLSSGGEEIGLFDSAGVAKDTVVFEVQAQDISFGRQPDGGPEWYSFDLPSPGRPNTSDAYLKTNNPGFSLPAGFYTEGLMLEISTEDPSVEIRYTTNGDEPNASSPIYMDPIPLNSRMGDPNVHSEIRTNEDPYHWLPDWVPPAGEVFKANVIRARAFKEGFYPSDIITGTYFVDAGIHDRYPTIPVISINSDSRHLFDELTGIYVPGVNHRSGDNGSGNYFQDWEKPAHIEFFESGGALGFAQDVGISIQGGTSPASPQKGLNVIARGAYGKNRIGYPLFENDPSGAKQLTEYKRFIIRAWGSLITGSLFNDAYAHRLMAENDLDIQAYRPAVVFINGEYWGLHELREANKNSWYYHYHHDIDRDDPGCDILLHSYRNGQPYAYIDEGDASHWNAMMNYINTHDMNLEGNYEYLKTRMDVDNFIAYMGHCIYVSKWDWPNNNDASWRPRTFDGKWKWTQYDMETGFGVATSLGPGYSSLGPQLNMIKAVVEGVEIPGFEKYGPHPIMAEIYENEEFTDAFTDWYTEHKSSVFHPDTMNAILDAMAAEIRPYMSEYQHRWPFIGSIRDDWETSLELIKEYNLVRPTYVEQHLWALSNNESSNSLEYQIFQNSPNPFKTSTIINYQVPEPATVLLRFYNTQGQQIDSYLQKHNAGGTYAMEWDAGRLSSGVYIVSMETEGFFRVMKLLKLAGE
ncbi:MAG: CotH kinase family protein, partial [Bacteroidales bacterium]|nr:CotH kinase family protein [Bacteroidales bacterium]